MLGGYIYNFIGMEAIIFSGISIKNPARTIKSVQLIYGTLLSISSSFEKSAVFHYFFRSITFAVGLFVKRQPLFRFCKNTLIFSALVPDPEAKPLFFHNLPNLLKRNKM
jgi:hypothetical protein